MTEAFRKILSDTYFQTTGNSSQNIPGRSYSRLHQALKINPDYQVETIAISDANNQDDPEFSLPPVHVGIRKNKLFIPLDTLLLLAKNPDSLLEIFDYYNQHKPGYSQALSDLTLSIIQKSLSSFLEQQTSP